MRNKYITLKLTEKEVESILNNSMSLTLKEKLKKKLNNIQKEKKNSIEPLKLKGLETNNGHQHNN